MKKKLIPIFVSALCVFNSGQLIASQKDNQKDNRAVNEEEGIAVGVGAMSGALIAGPVGFVIGGLVGVLFNHDDADESSVVAELVEVDEPEAATRHVDSDVDTYSDVPLAVTESNTDESNQADDLLLASASNDAFLIEHNKPAESNKLKEIITESLNIVVHFTPGSVTTESFYEEQFATVLNLLQEMPDIELNLAGYSDRRGTDAENVQLASQRVASIRYYFIQHGIEEHRIKNHAFGEKNLLSTYGELDSYMFDRRVVLSFSAVTNGSQENVAVVEPAISAEPSNSSPF